MILKLITGSKTKYNYWIIYLSPDAVILGRDIILNSDQTDLYKHLKDSVFSCGESETEEIRRLHVSKQLQDRKPLEYITFYAASCRILQHCE